MDPLSVIYLALTVLQTANSAYQIVRQIKDADIRIDTLKARLSAEKAATETWANQVRLANGLSSIPPDKLEEVEALCEKLQHYYARLENDFARISESNGKERSAQFLRKTWVAGGYERLKDLVEAIKAINDALKAIAPPLPPYSRFVFDESGRAGIENTHRPPTYRLPHRNEGSELPDMISTYAQSHKIVNANAVADSDTAANLNAIRLLDVYHAATQGLSALSEHSREMAHVAARLKLWGVGLFGEPASLDDIAQPWMLDEGEMNPLRHAILQATGHILVLEGESLGDDELGFTNTCPEKQLWREAQATKARSERLLEVRTGISALLGRDELIDIALEIMALYFEATARSEAGFEQLQHSITQQQDADDEADVVAKAVDKMSRFVENLFDILPAVRAQQKYHCYLQKLRREARRTEESNVLISNAQEQQSAVIQSERDVLQSNLVQVESRIAAHDRSDTEGQQWQPTWQKMRERLEGRLSPEVAEVHVQDLKAIKARQLEQKKTQQQLIEGLGEYKVRRA